MINDVLNCFILLYPFVILTGHRLSLLSLSLFLEIVPQFCTWLRSRCRLRLEVVGEVFHRAVLLYISRAHEELVISVHLLYPVSTLRCWIQVLLGLLDICHQVVALLLNLVLSIVLVLISQLLFKSVSVVKSESVGLCNLTGDLLLLL